MQALLASILFLLLFLHSSHVTQAYLGECKEFSRTRHWASGVPQGVPQLWCRREGGGGHQIWLLHRALLKFELWTSANNAGEKCKSNEFSEHILPTLMKHIMFFQEMLTEPFSTVQRSIRFWKRAQDCKGSVFFFKKKTHTFTLLMQQSEDSVCPLFTD